MRTFGSIASPAALGVLFALASTGIRAQPANSQLIFTELSDTSLTATVNGNPFGTVTNVSPDLWEWRSGAFGNVIHGPSLTAWAEPNSESGLNLISPAFYDANQNALGNMGLQIQSDFALSVDQILANGSFGFTFSGDLVTNNPDSTTVEVGPLDVYFTDLGDTARAPDGGSTLALLGLSCVGLAVVSRMRPVAKR